MFWTTSHDRLKECIEYSYIRQFVIDKIVCMTEDYFCEKKIKNDYYPRNINKMCSFTFYLNDDEYDWYMNKLVNRLEIVIKMKHKYLPTFQEVFNYEIYYDPTRSHLMFDKLVDKNIDRNKYNNLEATKLLVSEETYPIFEEYAKLLNEIVEKKKEIWELFEVRTNPGQPTASTYMVDDFIHKFEMELSWMKSEKYVSDRISFDDFLKMDIDDLNYNNTIYRLADRDPVKIAELFDHMKTVWMLGKDYRISNVYLNGLFYIENCDLQDVSECGYDTIDILCSDVNDTEPYKVVEIYLKEGNTNESNPKN